MIDKATFSKYVENTRTYTLKNVFGIYGVSILLLLLSIMKSIDYNHMLFLFVHSSISVVTMSILPVFIIRKKATQ